VSLGRRKIKPVGPSTDYVFRRGNFSICVLSMLRCMSLKLAHFHRPGLAVGVSGYRITFTVLNSVPARRKLTPN
jgi:hypothetical protein